MKFSRFLMAAVLIAPSFNLHAAAIATSSISVDWSTLTLDYVIPGTGGTSTGATLTPTTVFLPPELVGGIGGVTSGGADGIIWYGDNDNNFENGDFADNGAPVSVSYNSTDLYASASFTGASGGISIASASADASQPGDFRYAGANTYRGQVFEATQTGRILFTIDAMSSGSGSGSGPFFNATSGTSARLFVFDTEIFIDAFLAEYAINGGNEDAAEDAAAQLAEIKQRGWAIDTYGCSDGVACDPASSLSGELRQGFDVIAGNTYFVELEIEAIADAFGGNPAVVPVPAAVWLFGSGLIGLVGIARRKKA